MRESSLGKKGVYGGLTLLTRFYPLLPSPGLKIIPPLFIIYLLQSTD